MKPFKDFGLDKGIIQAITELGFESPTPIQEQVIPYLLNFDSDLIGLAQTGTGKTAAFGLPILQKTSRNTDHVQTLILCPTRELCLQITQDLKRFSKYLAYIHVLSVYGGADITSQIKGLKEGKQIVIATPGRALDLIRRNVLSLRKVKYLVLDESDEILSLGFRKELDSILEEMPSNKQTMLFSATMAPEINTIAKKYMLQPKEIIVGKKNIGSENIQHLYCMTQAKDRYIALKRIIDANPNMYGIIFCRTRQEAKNTSEKLMQEGYNTDALHGDLSQYQRDYVMNRFRSKHLVLLTATDVAARGLDVNNLSHIINYSLPDDAETYTHRSGRTGRAGKKGITISIIYGREKGKIQFIEQKIAKKFNRIFVPNGKEICENQLFHFIDKIEKLKIDELQVDPYLVNIYEKLEKFTWKELVRKFLYMKFNRLFNSYKETEDLNIKNEKPFFKQTHFSKFSINVGEKDGLTPGILINLINRKSSIKKLKIGKIDIVRDSSFFEIDSYYERNIVSVFKNTTFKAKRLILSFVKNRSNRTKVLTYKHKSQNLRIRRR